MQSQSEDGGEDRTLRLPAHGGTVAAEELRTAMVLASDFGEVTEIDASAVESIGQAVLQLLIAAKAEAASLDRGFAICNPSRAFVDRVNACGLADAIGLPVEKEPLP